MFFGFAGYAQSNYKVTGKVLDAATHQPIEYATITVADKSSKKVINGAITDANGAFEVGNLPAGAYALTIEFIGYQKKIIDSVLLSSAKKVVSLNNISLSAVGRSLQEVSITASAPVIENKIDKIVYNAANDITAQGGLALDVLKKVPMVNVDIDGNVELQGNTNILFLINGKPSSMFGNSVTDALAAIPASQIKSIEVITSPGAKYDAQGTGGIINIILKENKMQGINGNINLSGGTRLENGSANLNIRKNNFGVNLFVSGNAQLSSRTPTTQNRTSFDTVNLLQDGYTDFQRSGYQAGIGFDWSVSKSDNITVSFSYNRYGNTSEGITNIQQDTGSTNQPAFSSRNSYNRFETNSFDWSLDYKKTYKKENEELNILYSASYGDPNTYYRQMSIYPGAPDSYAGAISNNPGTNKQNNLSVDYTYPVTKEFVLETGAKTTLQDITSAAGVNTLQPDSQKYFPDPGQTYSLKYDMRVYAAYLSASFPVAKFLKVKLGARDEDTQTNVDFPNTSIPDYGLLVPSVILSHDIRNGQFIKLSYTRRIERPDYRDVNPFLNLADPYNITTGNPQLKPELGNNFELGYNKSFGKGSNIYISLVERINTQDHKQVTTFYSAYQSGDSVYTNVSVTNVQNTGTEYNSGVNVSGSWTIKDKLTFRSNAFITYRYIVSSDSAYNGVSGIRYRVNLNTSYQLPRDLVTEGFGNYNSATNSIQGKTPQSLTYTFAFRKQFWKKNASVGVTATNIFSQYIRQVTTITTADYTSYNVRMLPYRSVGISLTYKFGKLEFKKPKEDDSYLNNPPVMGG